jgi:hypothetical protein
MKNLKDMTKTRSKEEDLSIKGVIEVMNDYDDEDDPMERK